MKPPAKLGKKFTTLSKTFLHSLLGQIVIAFQPTEATMKWDYFLVPIGLNVMYFANMSVLIVYMVRILFLIYSLLSCSNISVS